MSRKRYTPAQIIGKLREAEVPLPGAVWLLGSGLALLAGGLVAAAFGFVTGFPVFRVRGDYLAIVTLGFGGVAPGGGRAPGAVGACHSEHYGSAHGDPVFGALVGDPLFPPRPPGAPGVFLGRLRPRPGASVSLIILPGPVPESWSPADILSNN